MSPITMDDEKAEVVVNKAPIAESKSTAPPAEIPAYAPRIQKDAWDKVAAVAPIISGVLIFAMGGYFTYSYNQQQLRVQEIQTIEKFIPHLMGNDQSKRAAILAISSLTNAELAGKFAQIFASRGTVSALQSIAENGSESDRSTASSALAKALENIQARESKLNEMENAFQQALSDKTGQVQQGHDVGASIEEADRLEKLADMSRSRGQISVAESLLKQAVNIRLRVQTQSDAKDVIASLKKLADVEAASGDKDESENVLKKIAQLESKFGGQSASNLPPPPPPPTHDSVSVPVKAVLPKGEKGEGENNAREKDQREPSGDNESKGEKESNALDREHSASAGEGQNGG